MGFVKNFEGLLVARIFLGITEAGLFPGVRQVALHIQHLSARLIFASCAQTAST